MRPGLGNWSEVRAGERLSSDDGPELLSPHDDYVLFPKYGEPGAPRPAELYRLATWLPDPDALSADRPVGKS